MTSRTCAEFKGGQREQLTRTMLKNLNVRDISLCLLGNHVMLQGRFTAVGIRDGDDEKVETANRRTDRHTN